MLDRAPILESDPLFFYQKKIYAPLATETRMYMQLYFMKPTYNNLSLKTRFNIRMMQQLLLDFL